MDISGIFFIEEGNTNSIHLYKEGSFWKAYEQSAYLFVQHIKAYQTKLRYYKNIDQEIISIGFPDIALAKILEGHKIIRQSETGIEIQIELDESVSGFREWKAQTSLTFPSKEGKKSREMTDQQHFWMMAICSFPIADKTPLECMQFISELQKSVMDYKI